MNNINLIGNMTKDPELKYIPGSGTAVATFTIGVKRSFAKEGEQQTDFVFCQVFGKIAENVSNYCNKGSKVGVTGELRIDSWKDESGNYKSITKVNCRSVEFLSKSDATKGQGTGFTPNYGTDFEPSGLDPQGFQAIDDDDIPF